MTNTLTISRELAERLDSPHSSVRNAAFESLRRIIAAPVVERQELVFMKPQYLTVKGLWIECGESDPKAFAFFASPPTPVAVVLTVKEKRFLKIVCEHPGSKLNGGEANDDEGNALWERLETLGLIECVGSYKWKPTFDVIDLAISACLDKAKEMNR